MHQSNMWLVSGPKVFGMLTGVERTRTTNLPVHSPSCVFQCVHAGARRFLSATWSVHIISLILLTIARRLTTGKHTRTRMHAHRHTHTHTLELLVLLLYWFWDDTRVSVMDLLLAWFAHRERGRETPRGSEADWELCAKPYKPSNCCISQSELKYENTRVHIFNNVERWLHRPQIQ